MKTRKSPQLKGITTVRVVEWHPGNYSQDSEVNEAIKLGWQLLLVQPGEFHPCFVLGWVGPETPPMTAWQNHCKQFSDAVKRRSAA